MTEDFSRSPVRALTEHCQMVRHPRQEEVRGAFSLNPIYPFEGLKFCKLTRSLVCGSWGRYGFVGLSFLLC